MRRLSRDGVAIGCGAVNERVGKDQVRVREREECLRECEDNKFEPTEIPAPPKVSINNQLTKFTKY